MASGQRKTGSLPGRGTFELHGLDWAAPDRLEVTGVFKRLAAPPAQAPVLVVRGPEGTHRLPAVPESLSGAPEEGQPWRAEFAWEVAPCPFDAAALELGDTILEFGTLKASDDAANDSAAAQSPNATDGESAGAAADADGDGAPATLPPAGAAAERLHLQAEMLVAHAAAREAGAEAERLRAELSRATDDLESERARHAVDADRFRQGLAAVEDSAREALAVEQSVAQQLRTDLQHAHDAIAERGAELERVRAQLEAAEVARAEADSELRKELVALRERVAELERSGEEAAQARAAFEEAEAEAQRARAESERLSSRIARIREALDDPA